MKWAFIAFTPQNYVKKQFVSRKIGVTFGL